MFSAVVLRVLVFCGFCHVADIVDIVEGKCWRLDAGGVTCRWPPPGGQGVTLLFCETGGVFVAIVFLFSLGSG